MPMLLCLILPQRSLKLSLLFLLFIFFFFFCSLLVISMTRSSNLLIHSSILFNLLFISLSVFLISVLDSSSLFIPSSYYNSLVKTYNFSLCSLTHFLSSLIIFIITTLNSLSVRLHISTSLCSFSLFLCLEHAGLVLHFAQFAFFISMHLICWL